MPAPNGAASIKAVTMNSQKVHDLYLDDIGIEGRVLAGLDGVGGFDGGFG